MSLMVLVIDFSDPLFIALYLSGGALMLFGGMILHTSLYRRRGRTDDLLFFAMLLLGCAMCVLDICISMLQYAPSTHFNGFVPFLSGIKIILYILTIPLMAACLFYRRKYILESDKSSSSPVFLFIWAVNIILNRFLDYSTIEIGFAFVLSLMHMKYMNEQLQIEEIGNDRI